MAIVTILRSDHWKKLLEYLYTFGSTIKMQHDPNKNQLLFQVSDPYKTVVVQTSYHGFRSESTRPWTVYLHAPAVIQFLQDLGHDELRASSCAISLAHDADRTYQIETVPQAAPRAIIKQDRPSNKKAEKKEESAPSSSDAAKSQTLSDSAVIQTKISLVSQTMYDFLNIEPSVTSKPTGLSLTHQQSEPADSSDREAVVIESYNASEIPSQLLNLSLIGTEMKWCVDKYAASIGRVHMATKSESGIVGYEWLAQLAHVNDPPVDLKHLKSYQNVRITSRIKMHQWGTRISDTFPIRSMRMLMTWASNYPPSRVEMRFSRQSPLRVKMWFPDYTIESFVCPSSDTDNQSWSPASEALEKTYDHVVAN